MEEQIFKLKEEMNWYAVRTMNNLENKVKERFLKEVESSPLQDKVGGILIPTEKIISVKNGNKVLRERALYPGYIFIQTSARGEVERILKGIDGTPGMVRTRDGVITPMKKREIDNIIELQEVTDSKDTKDIFSIGEEVEIIDGAFSSFKGKIEKLDAEKEKIKLMVSIFGRPTPVELSFSQVRKY
jgi:transcriptional antiterminator NusG